MKPYRIAALFALSLIAYAMTACVTTKTTITHPDGRVEVIETTAPAPGSIEAAGDLAKTAAEIAAAKNGVQPVITYDK